MGYSVGSSLEVSALTELESCSPDWLICGGSLNLISFLNTSNAAVVKNQNNMAKMHRKLFNWFQDKRAKLGGKKGKAKQAQEGPKPLVLPWTCRSSPLSPTPSCTDLIASASAATADSAFFRRLPSEIRREILVMAFGNRTMHMSLEFNHPRQLSDLEMSRWGRYVPPTVHYPPQRLEPDKQAPMAWQWRGCLCWRTGHPNHPHNDLCLPGVARCWEHASDVPDMCLIGAMGWLLTCRLA